MSPILSGIDFFDFVFFVLFVLVILDLVIFGLVFFVIVLVVIVLVVIILFPSYTIDSPRTLLESWFAVKRSMTDMIVFDMPRAIDWG